jgi:hypothetical protein
VHYPHEGARQIGSRARVSRPFVEVVEEMMGFSSAVLGVVWASIGVAVSLAACGDTRIGPGSGGDTTEPPTTQPPPFPCSPGTTCTAVDKECLGLVDNAGKSQFGLRISELQILAPLALQQGIVATIVGGAVLQADPACNLPGSGTFSWLLQLDLAAGTLKTGGAKPVADPTAGYSFIDEVLDGKQVSPITFDVKPDADGNFGVSAGQDLVVPIFLDMTGSQYVLLPLKQARITEAHLSESHNCIGHYNAEGLDPINACLPDDQNHTFVAGAKLDGLITLEDADAVFISSLKATLCVVLAGNMGVVGPDGVKVCERDPATMKIKVMGDTCSTGSGCGDSFALAAELAASSVEIH